MTRFNNACRPPIGDAARAPPCNSCVSRLASRRATARPSGDGDEPRCAACAGKRHGVSCVSHHRSQRTRSRRRPRRSAGVGLSPPAIGGTGPPAPRPTQPPPPTRPRPRRACPELSREQPRRANRAPRQTPAPKTAPPTPPLRRASRPRPSSLRPKRPRPKRPRRTRPPLQPDRNRTARRGGAPPPRPPPPRLPARAARPPSRGCSARGSPQRGRPMGSGSRPPAPRSLRVRARERLPCAAGDVQPGLFFAAAESARAGAVWEDGRERLPRGDARLRNSHQQTRMRRVGAAGGGRGAGAHVRDELPEGVRRGRVAHPGEVQQHLQARARRGGASRHVAP